jgi:hypothetical protein
MVVNKADTDPSVSIKGENLLTSRPIFEENLYVIMLFKSVKTALYSKYWFLET